MSPGPRRGDVMTPRGEVFEAVVVIGGAETPYRCGGSGSATVVLLTDRAGLFDELVHAVRVVEPLRRLAHPGSPAWQDWLRAVVDGLGLDRTVLVVEPALAGAARRLASIDPDRFGAVVEAATPAAVRSLLLARNESIDV